MLQVQIQNIGAQLTRSVPCVSFISCIVVLQKSLLEEILLNADLTYINLEGRMSNNTTELKVGWAFIVLILLCLLYTIVFSLFTAKEVER